MQIDLDGRLDTGNSARSVGPKSQPTQGRNLLSLDAVGVGGRSRADTPTHCTG